MISSTPFVVVDLETTGLVPSLDKIIEIAAVKVLDGEIVDEWSSFVNPGVFVPDEITNFTGITSDMVASAPTFEELVSEYLSFVGEDCVFVAHNVDFDREFLNQKFSDLSMEKPDYPYLCTIRLAKHVHPNLNKYNLGDLASTFNVELPQAHRALNDAKATAELFIKFMNVLRAGGLNSIKDIPTIQNYKSTRSANDCEGQISLF